MVRSGDEPAHARSALRLRLTLAVIGWLTAWAGAVLLWRDTRQPGEALIAAAAGLVAMINAGVVLARLRTGPHYQPGPDVPPYRPVDDPSPRHPSGAGDRQRPPTPKTRQRRYLILMAICLFLITNAWVWVRLVSVPAAVVMSLVAAVIPPLAAIVANAGWSERDGPSEPPPPRRQ